ncbi:WD40 repeat domain-containing protein [Aspergillus chevalieri]|uniref:WD40 repeat-like protein n=1 Tax=Aspergillus chevalieri TaxID=182096 RepID=A0A7R7ZQR3_ASPCH|nr:uncharacterized protein ACHE_51174S [Aspergillus chevalieri]BCR89976.1 hypothetical protein ACHE_51174S [Aspergillus chevalieri]
MSLMGIIQEAVGMINTLQSSIGGHTDSEISKFLYDAKRFLLKNIHIIDIAPYQLYCSALIFSPTESIIRKAFEGERFRKIHILPQEESFWSAEIQTLEGHSGSVLSVAFSADGQTVASGSGDRTIKLWDVTIGEERRTLKGHSNCVWSVAFSPDWQTVASGSRDNTIRLWDVTTGEERRTLKGHSGSVLFVAFPADGQTVASGSGDRTIKLWDVTTGEERRTLKGHSNCVWSVAFSPDWQTVASGSGDQTIKLWDVTTGEERQTLKGHSKWVRSLAFSPDGRTVASRVSLSDDWVAFGSEKVLWLPSEYRTFSSSATRDDILALGYSDGRVFVVGFPTD